MGLCQELTAKNEQLFTRGLIHDGCIFERLTLNDQTRSETSVAA